MAVYIRDFEEMYENAPYYQREQEDDDGVTYQYVRFAGYFCGFFVFGCPVHTLFI
jgi:hypothetical protein